MRDGKNEKKPLQSAIRQAKKWHEWAALLHACVLLGFAVAFIVALANNRPGLIVRLTDERIAVGGTSGFRTENATGFRTEMSKCTAICATDVYSDKTQCALDRDEQWELVQKAANSKRVQLSFSIGYLLVLVELVTAAAHLRASRLSDEQWQIRFLVNNNPDRWVEYGISAGFMTVGMASLVRVNDFTTMLGFFMENVGTQMCGHLAEVAAPTKLDKKLYKDNPQLYVWPHAAALFAYALGWLFFLATWVPLTLRWLQFFSSVDDYADDFIKILSGVDDLCTRDKELAERFPEVSYSENCDSPIDSIFSIPTVLKLAVAVPALLYLTFAFVAGRLRYKQLQVEGEADSRLPPVQYYKSVERWYIGLSFIVKLLLALLVGIGMLDEDPEFDLGRAGTC